MKRLPNTDLRIDKESGLSSGIKTESTPFSFSFLMLSLQVGEPERS